MFFDSLLSDLWIIYCKLCVKECYNHEISQINSELLATPIQSNDKKIINQLLKRIEHLGKENSDLKEKLDFYKSKGKSVVITEAEEIESYEEIAYCLLHQYFWQDFLL